MTSGDHPAADFGAVVDWLEGRLDADDAARIERLVLAGVPDVVATVAWWRRFHAAAVLPTEYVPDGLGARLREMGPPAPRGAASTRDPSRLERLVGVVRASLSFDSLQTPGLAMARSTADATRQLVFSGPGLEVAVDVSESRGDELVGTAQLLPLDDNAGAVDVLVQTWARSGLVCEQRSDALGRVELGVLPAEVVVIEVDRSSTWPVMHAELDLRRPG